MNRYTLTSVQSSKGNSYVEQIDHIMNKMRARLPSYLMYQPDKHFEHLCNNNNEISESTLLKLIPLKKQFYEHQLNKYLSSAINILNNNTTRISPTKDIIQPQNLSYRGYLRLVRIQMNGYWDIQGSQVNKTLAKRLTFDFQSLNDFRSIQGEKNKQKMHLQVDSIIGFLLFLQCLKVKQKSALLNIEQQNNQQNLQNVNFNNKRNAKDLLMLNDTKQNVGQFHNNERELRVQQSVRKPIFSFANKTRFSFTQHHTPRPKPRIPFASTKRTTGTNFTDNTYQKQTRNLVSPVNDDYNPEQQQFLKTFSNEKSIWKNINQRNTQYRVILRKGGFDDNSAFLEQQNQKSRMFYLRSPSNAGKQRLINYMNKSNYYIK